MPTQADNLLPYHWHLDSGFIVLWNLSFISDYHKFVQLIEMEHCGTPYIYGNPFFGVCGTDNEDYYDIYHLRCEQRSKYRKRLNLQLKHHWKCYTWESYREVIFAILQVNKRQIDLISIETIQIFIHFFAVFIVFTCSCLGSGWCVLVHLSSNSSN